MRPRLAIFALFGTCVVLLVACGGGGGSGSGTLPVGPTSTVAPTQAAATPTPPGASTQTNVTTEGATFGTPDEFTPNVGDTSSGGQGQTVDGISCDPTMSNNYHVHVYLGLFVNGSQVALPAGVGMNNPGAFGSGDPSYPGFINSASCFYHIHIHDQSGIVHIEDPDPNAVPITGSLYTLQNLFDIWGITVNSGQFGPFSGGGTPLRVFTTGQVFRGDCDSTATCTVPATDLTYYGDNPSSIPMYSHEVIFVEVGPTWPTTLPNIQFYTEN